MFSWGVFQLDNSLRLNNQNVISPYFQMAVQNVIIVNLLYSNYLTPNGTCYCN